MRRARVGLLIVVGALLALVAIGEARPARGPEKLPPVTPALIKAGAKQQLDAKALQAGRNLYLARCGKCHELYAPSRYSTEKWSRAVPKMAKRSGLRGEQVKNVLGYVVAARAQ